LAKKFTKNNSAAFIAGLIFAFSPTHFAYAQGYGGATHIEWIPFFILFLFKIFEKYKITDFMLAGIFYLFIYINEPHFILYISIFSLFFVVYKIYKTPRIFDNKKFKILFSIAMVMVLLLTAWQYYERSLSSSDITADMDQVIELSNDSLAIMTPPVFHRIWGNYFSSFINSNFTGNSAENTIYLGIVALFLIFVAIWKRKNIKDFNFWLFGGVFFFILSLGPFLHFKGLIEPMIPSLYLIFYESNYEVGNQLNLIDTFLLFASK